MIEIGKRIQNLRSQQKLSGNALSKLANVPQSTISELENNKYLPTLETLNRICAALGITLAEFFADDREPVSIPPHLKRLLDQSRDLTPEQVEQLNKFIAAMKK